MNWKQACITEVQAAVGNGKPSATRLAELCSQEIDARNPAINAFLAVSPERAFHAAAAVESRRAGEAKSWQEALNRHWSQDFPANSNH
jgi:Asp-tRNA(Asn)/Glu-tRNA(Gln) amidotransferase A subunit family amidase